jgi:hypothetical protein
MRTGYILSPFETPDSLRRLARETKDLEKNKRNQIVVNQLIPYFGTQVRRQYRHLLVNPDDPWLLNDETILWDHNYNPAAHRFMVNALKFLTISNSNFGWWADQARRETYASATTFESPVTISPFDKVRAHAKTTI